MVMMMVILTLRYWNRESSGEFGTSSDHDDDDGILT